jgi:chemotaxis protein CheD
MMAGAAPLRRASLLCADAPLAQIPVRIGEARVATGSSLLFTLGLGSCVGVALYDAGAHIGGLAHVMLPRARASHPAAPPGRFATTAIPHLLELMLEQGASMERVQARLAGGASMFSDMLEQEGLRLGERNVEAAREALALAGVPLTGQDVLGTWGRNLFLRTTDGRLVVASVKHGEHVL